LMKNTPQVPQENKEELQRHENLIKQKQGIEQQIIGINEQLAILDAIETKIEVLKDDISAFNVDILELLEKVDLAAEKDDFVVSIPPKGADVLASRRTVLTKAVAVLKSGDGSEDPASQNLQAIDTQIAELQARSKLTDAKRKEYAKFQKDRQLLEDSIGALEREIKEIADDLMPRAKAEVEAREERYLDCFELLREERAILDKLYEPLRSALLVSNEIAQKLMFVSKITFAATRHAGTGAELLDRRKAVFRDQQELEDGLRVFFEQIEGAAFDRAEIKRALGTLRESFIMQGGAKVRIEDQLRKDRTAKDFADWFFSIEDFAVTYSIKFDGKDLHLLSPGEKGIVLLLLYLEAENEDHRPLIIDQPDDNLDNVSVYPSLI
jgi:hypothetical protein